MRIISGEHLSCDKQRGISAASTFPAINGADYRRRAPRRDYSIMFVQRKALRHDYSLMFVQRRAPRRDYSLMFVQRRAPRRQSYDTSHRRNGRGGACVPARTSAQRRFHPQKGTLPTHKGGVSIRKEHIPTRKGDASIHKRCMPTPKHVCALCRWMRPHGATRAGTQAPPLPTSIKAFFRQPSRAFVHRRTVCRQPDDRLGFNGSERPKHGSAANCLRQSEPWWPQRQQAVSRRWDGSSNRTCRRSR